MDKPLKRKKPTMYFVCSMGDLFHETVPWTWIDHVMKVIGQCPQHTFQILTKRSKRMLEYFSQREIPANAWLGVTAENQAMADERIPHLLRTPAAVRFVSVEPMIGPVLMDDDWMDRTCSKCRSLDFGPCKNGPAQCWEPSAEYEGDSCGCTESTGIDWIICGCESGPGRRPMNPLWAADLLEQCRGANVPFFMKQMQTYKGRVINQLTDFPEWLRERKYPKIMENQ